MRCLLSRYSFSPRPEQPAAELQDLEVDRQQPVGVVEDERHVGHALRGPLLRAGPDDVLGLARAERPALLAERPAERVGEVALARAVRPDDGADPAPNSTFVRSANDLKPCSRRASRRGAAGHGPPVGAVRAARRRSRRSIRRVAAPRALAGATRCARIRSIACGRRRRLGDPARRALADAEHLAVDPDLDPERLLVVGAGRVDAAGTPAARRSSLGVFLQPALGALERAIGRLQRELGRGQRRSSQSRTRSKPRSR